MSPVLKTQQRRFQVVCTLPGERQTPTWEWVDVFDSRRNTYSSSCKKKVVATAILLLARHSSNYCKHFVERKYVYQRKHHEPWRSLSWGSANILQPAQTVTSNPAFKILLRQLDSVSTRSQIAWTSLSSTSLQGVTLNEDLLQGFLPWVACCMVDCFRI